MLPHSVMACGSGAHFKEFKSYKCELKKQMWDNFLAHIQGATS